MDFVHKIIGFIKTLVLIVVGFAIGFVLGAMTHPVTQAMGIENVAKMLDAGGINDATGQGIITQAALGGVIGGLIGWGIAWLTRRKKPAASPAA